MDSQMHVIFENEDYVYNVGEIKDFVQLPDGRILGVECWLESYPVQPGGLYVVKNPDNIAKQDICQLHFEPKTQVFSFEGMDYAASSRLVMVQYVLLPDNTLLEYEYPTDSGDELPEMKYKRAENVDLQEQMQNENVLKAELKGPTKRLKM